MTSMEESHDVNGAKNHEDDKITDDNDENDKCKLQQQQQYSDETVVDKRPVALCELKSSEAIIADDKADDNPYKADDGSHDNANNSPSDRISPVPIEPLGQLYHNGGMDIGSVASTSHTGSRCSRSPLDNDEASRDNASSSSKEEGCPPDDPLDVDEPLAHDVDETLDDELAYKVQKSLAGMQELLANVDSEISHYSDEPSNSPSNPEYDVHDAKDMDPTNDVNVLTDDDTIGDEMLSTSNGDDTLDTVVYKETDSLSDGDEEVLKICDVIESDDEQTSDSTRAVHNFLKEDDGVRGATQGDDDTTYDSDCGSSDSLHRKVEKSLVDSRQSLNQMETASSATADDDEDDLNSTTTSERNPSVDEFEIFDTSQGCNASNGLVSESPNLENNQESVESVPPGSGVPVMFSISLLKRKFDSVDNIMDKIDAGISTLKDIQVTVRDPTRSNPDKNSNAVDTNVADEASSSPNDRDLSTTREASNTKLKLDSPAIEGSMEEGATYSCYARFGQKNGINGFTAHYYDNEDDDNSSLTGSDNHSDLDSEAALATDAKFSEILNNKHISLVDPRVAALRHQEPSTETESVRTEDFETAFQRASQPIETNQKSSNKANSLAEESTDTPLTEEFEERFKASLSFPVSQYTTTLHQSRIPTPARTFTKKPIAAPKNTLTIKRNTGLHRSNSAPVRKSPSPYYGLTKTQPTPKPIIAVSKKTDGLAYNKHKTDLAAIDTLDEISDIEPEMNDMIKRANGNVHYEADSESEDGDFAQQIREQTSRIQREIELERKLKTRQTDRQNARGSNEQLNFHESDQSGYNTLPRYHGNNSQNGLHAFQAYSASTPDMPSLLAAQQASNLLKGQLEEDSLVMRQLHNERMQLMQETNKLKDDLKRLENEVASSELQAKENRARAEESRSHMMVAEFKKESLLKEIGRLSTEIEEGRRIIEEAEDRQEHEDSILNSIGITIEVVPNIVEERDNLKKHLEAVEKSMEAERDTTSKQTESLKTEMAEKEESMQAEIDTLRETVQRLNCHVERLTDERDNFKRERDAVELQCENLRRDMSAGEKAKAQALEQTIKGYDEMRRNMEREASDVKAQLTNELSGVKKLLAIEEQKASKLREEITLRDELNQSLREQLHTVRQKATEEEEANDNALRELKKQLKNSEEAKLEAWESCRQAFDTEKQKLIESTQEDLERQHQETLRVLREEHQRQVNQIQHLLKNKEEEAYMLRDRLSEQEQDYRQSIDKLKSETRHQVEQAIDTEKRIWEKEQKYVENEQIRQYREKEENQKDQLKSQIEAEVRRRKHVEEQASASKAEIEEFKQNLQRLSQEKQSLSHKLKQLETSSGEQLEKGKQELKQHFEKVILQLKSEISEKDEELDRVRAENSSLVQTEADACLALEKFEKMIIGEINDECKKTADLLGVQHRKATAVGFSRSSSPAKNKIRKRTVSRSLAASAIANLRACNEELRNSLAETKSEVSQMNETIEKSERNKEHELEQLRNRLNNERKQEMEEMRTSLAKKEQMYITLIRQANSPHLAEFIELHQPAAQSSDVDDDDEGDCNCMPTCKRSLIDPSDSYHIKADRRTSEKAVRSSLSGSYSKLNGTLDFSSGVLDEPQEPTNTKSPQTTNDRLKHIRAGSPFRYKSSNLASSSPDISKLSASQGGFDTIEQKVRLAELKAKLAEERATRNQAMLSQKMQEVVQLQNMLNGQTKEIMGLERSCENLRSAQYSPSRYSLNNTFPY